MTGSIFFTNVGTTFFPFFVSPLLLCTISLYHHYFSDLFVSNFNRKNLLDLKIYFEELSYQEIEQVPAYDVGSLQSK